MVWVMDVFMPHYHPRFMIGAATSFVVLVAAGLVWIGRRWRVVTYAALAVFVLAGLYADRRYYTDPVYQKSAYGAVMAQIGAEAQPGDFILLNNGAQMPLFHYDRPAGVGAAMIEADKLYEEGFRDYLAGLVGDAPRVWLVEVGDPAGFDGGRRAPLWLSEIGYREQFYTFLGGLVSLFVRGETSHDWQEIEDAHFGAAITLTGYAIEPPDPHPGDLLFVALRWDADAPIEASYTVGNYLLDADGQLVAQVDGVPAGGARPTDGWQPGETIIDRHVFTLPADLPPDTYTLSIGLYEWPYMTRLPVGDGDLLALAEIEINTTP
jgi:hypothetical protein